MQKVGEITAVQADWLEVTFCRPADCEHCHACEGGQKSTVVKVRGEGRLGDYAAVELPTGTVVKASLLAYAFPLAGFLGGIAVGTAMGSSAAAAGLGLLGLALPVAVVAMTEKKRRASPDWQPTLVRVIPREPEERPAEEQA